jgi:hypothetical protein
MWYENVIIQNNRINKHYLLLEYWLGMRNAVSILMSMWLYHLNSAFYLPRSPLFLMRITWTQVYIGYLPAGCSMPASFLILKPNKQDIPMLSFTCAGPLSCAVRVLQYVSVCLMGASGRKGRVDPRLITEKGCCRNIRKLYSSPSKYFRWNSVAVMKGT